MDKNIVKLELRKKILGKNQSISDKRQEILECEICALDEKSLKTQQKIGNDTEELGSFLVYNNDLGEDFSQIANCIGKANIFVPAKIGEKREFNTKFLCISEIVNEKTSPEKTLKILVKNERLNQWDLTLWLFLIKNMDKNLTYKGSFSSILSKLGVVPSPFYYKKLRESLDALNNARVKFVEFETTPKGRTISTYEKSSTLLDMRVLTKKRISNSEENPDVRVWISLGTFLHTFIDGSGDHGWSFIDLKTRQIPNISQSALALQTFISINKCPKNGYWFTVESFCDLFCNGEKTILYYIKKRILAPFLEKGIIGYYVPGKAESGRKKKEVFKFCLMWQKGKDGVFMSQKSREKAMKKYGKMN